MPKLLQTLLLLATKIILAPEFPAQGEKKRKTKKTTGYTQIPYCYPYIYIYI